jgi:hypothetical protein
VAKGVRATSPGPHCIDREPEVVRQRGEARGEVQWLESFTQHGDQLGKLIAV